MSRISQAFLSLLVRALSLELATMLPDEVVVAEDYARGMGESSRLQDDTDIHNGLADAAFIDMQESPRSLLA